MKNSVHPIKLVGDYCALTPLSLEHHDELSEAAADADIGVPAGARRRAGLQAGDQLQHFGFGAGAEIGDGLGIDAGDRDGALQLGLVAARGRDHHGGQGVNIRSRSRRVGRPGKPRRRNGHGSTDGRQRYAR